MNDPLQPHGQPQGPQHLTPENNFGTNQAAAQHFGIAQLEPQDDGWGKIGVVMVALAVVFAGGVAYFIATSGSSESGETQAAAVLAPGDAGASADIAPPAVLAAAKPVGPEPTNQAAADAGASPSSAPTPAPEAVTGTIGLLRANGEIDRPAGLVSLAIESEPKGATVVRKRDGVRLGMTPYRYETEAARGEVAFLLKLDGYRTTSVSMPGDKDSVRQVMLLPGSGGAVVPAAPVASTAPEKSAKPRSVAKRPSKPKRTERPKRVDRPRSPPKRSAPKAKPPSKSGGKVDYQADPIPL